MGWQSDTDTGVWPGWGGSRCPERSWWQGPYSQGRPGEKQGAGPSASCGLGVGVPLATEASEDGSGGLACVWAKGALLASLSQSAWHT